MNSPLMLASGWAVLHFLWQGAAIAAVLWAVLSAVSKQHSRIRYGLASGALLSMLLCFAGNVIYFYDVNPILPIATATPAPELTAGTQQAVPNELRELLPRAVPYISMIWLAGVALLQVRLLGGWLVTRRLVRAHDGSLFWTRVAAGLAGSMAIRKPVAVCESIHAARLWSLAICGRSSCCPCR